MGYTASPRPRYPGPAHIPYSGVARHLWGDETSGQVSDWLYLSNDNLHQMVFALPPQGAFRHSDDFRTVFAADEVYYVLNGVLVVNNPETGEVHRAQAGEAVFFRRDTWHYGFNYSQEQLRVLEFFAPPPSRGTSGAYALGQPNLAQPRSGQDQWLGHWPISQPEAESCFSMRVLREPDVLWRLEGKTHPLLVGILASTEHLTVAKFELFPGQRADAHQHQGDEGLYVLSGSMHVRVFQETGPQYFELQPGDGFYVPAGVRHEYYNIASQPARAIFAVAPTYLADAP